MAASGSSLIITACSHGGAQFGIAQSVQITKTVNFAPISGQGDLGTTALGTTNIGGHAVVTWVGGAGSGLIAPGTKGTLAFTSKDCEGGGSKTYTATNMAAGTGSITHADRTYAIYTQEFVNVSSDGSFLS